MLGRKGVATTALLLLQGLEAATAKRMQLEQDCLLACCARSHIVSSLLSAVSLLKIGKNIENYKIGIFSYFGVGPEKGFCEFSHFSGFSMLGGSLDLQRASGAPTAQY